MHVSVLISIILLSTFSTSNEIHSLNILGVFPYQGKSHFHVFEPYLKELASRGHNLTVISYFPQKEPIKNYHDISLAGKAMIFEGIVPFQKQSLLTNVFTSLGLSYMAVDNCHIMMDDDEVQDLWKTKMKFDVAVVEQFNGDCALGLAHILNAPVVALTSHHLMPYHFDRYGISYNPSYIPFLLSDGSTKSTLMQRLEHTLLHIYFNLSYRFITQRYEYKILSKYVDNIPPLEELGRNIKFLLLYNNMILTGSNILPANVIEVGGYHVPKPQPLNDEILKFVEESKHGVIYISFGSMLRTASMPKDKMQAILDALAELPQRVVWKWEAKSLPGKPKNVFVSKWLPQNDLLAHPNVVAFYSHCGMLGTTEALHHGVPLVGMPMFADQFRNAAAVEESGFGVTVKLENLTKDNLLKKFKTVLDPMFRANVKLLSKAWHDRPKPAMDTAIHWTEFTAKYPSLTFRSPAADIPLYQYYCVDIIFILSMITITIICIGCIVYKTFFKSKNQKICTKKDKNI